MAILRTLMGALVVAIGLLAGSSWAADSGFLTDYSRLESRPGNLLGRVYLAPEAMEKLSGMNALMIDQPEVLLAPDSKYKGAKPDHLKMLADSLRIGVTQEFEAGGYTTADAGGPGVVYMDWAVTDLYLKKKKRGLLTFTPIGFVVHSTVQAAIQDVWKKIDIVELNVEAEFVDSTTGEVIASVVMERGARKTKNQKQELVSWEDLDVAMRTFGRRLVCNLDNARKADSDRENCAAVIAPPPAA